MVKMGVRYTRVGGGPVGGENYQKAGPMFRKIVNQEFAAVGEEGLGEAQGFVDIAGTNRQWTGVFRDRSEPTPRDRSGRGRVHTGNMRNALDFRVYMGSTEMGVDLGWIHDSSFEEYMLAQDTGFSAPGYRFDHQFVQGMGLFQHLRVYMRDRVSKAADRIMERFQDGL